MAIEFNRNAVPAAKEPFWRKEVKMLPGGFSMKNTFPVGSVIRKSSPIYVDFATMSAAVVKVGKVLTGGTTTAPRVSKGHNFVVGDLVMKIGATGKAVTVSSIDKTNSVYDVITFSAALTGVAAGDFVQEAVADSDNFKVKYTANMVLGADVEVKEVGMPTLDASYDCIILKSIAAPIPEEWLVSGGCGLATNPRIMYINQ